LTSAVLVFRMLDTWNSFFILLNELQKYLKDHRLSSDGPLLFRTTLLGLLWIKRSVGG